MAVNSKGTVLLLSIAGFLGGSTPIRAQASAEPLVGIWASENVFGPQVRGDLDVFVHGKDGRAVAGSVSVTFSPKGDSIRFAFDGGGGSFRGMLAQSGEVIRGFWVQPPGLVMGEAFASPLVLRRTAVGTWHGTIVPLDDRYSLYLSVSRNTAGNLVGVFRNPDLNQPFNSRQYVLKAAGDSVVFSARPDTTQPEIRRVARYDAANRQMVLWWPDVNRTLVLTPTKEADAVGLFAKLPRGADYAYHAPLQLGDGWPVGRASEVGFDEGQLQRLVQRIADTIPTLSRAPLIHSMLIARHGKIVLDEYFFGHDADRTHDTRSAAKTFASVMLGAAMLNGAPISTTTKVYPLLSPSGSHKNPDPRKQNITVGHLLTHSSGLACDDNDGESPGNEGTMAGEQNWTQYIIDLPMANNPGAKYAYCSGGMNLVGASITKATGTWLPEFFDRNVAIPLQFGRYYYNLSPTEDGYTGGGAFVRPRDLMKIGEAYLHGGVWNGKRIAPAAWVTQSTTKQIEWPYQNVNVSAGADGFGWHLNEIKSGDRTYREVEANGNGGQLLMIVPELDLVVVFTAGNYGGGGVWSRFRSDLLGNVIIPAIRDQT